MTNSVNAKDGTDVSITLTDINFSLLSSIQGNFLFINRSRITRTKASL